MLDEALFEYFDIQLDGEVVSNADETSEPDEPDYWEQRAQRYSQND